MISWILTYIFAAILPAVIIMVYLYNKDPVEKEPLKLLLSLIGLGVASSLIAMVLEIILEPLLTFIVQDDSPYFTTILSFTVIAFSEEGAKLLMLRIRTWEDPNFNYRFDSIVYAAYVSLGFAAFENILYVFQYGIGIAPLRAVFSIPGHLSFSILMGLFYGRARYSADLYQKSQTIVFMIIAFLSAIALHGTYDALAMSSSAISDIYFYCFVVFMYLLDITIIHHEAKHDCVI